MKYALALIASLYAATAARATGGYVCTAAGKNPLTMNIVIGHAVAAVIVQATLIEGKTVWSTVQAANRLVILQHWLNDKTLWLDLTDPNVERYEARVRLRLNSRRHARGTIERGGRTSTLRCHGEQ